MITNFFLGVLFSLANWVLGLLPIVTSLPMGLDSTINLAFGLFHGMVSIFPFLASAISFLLLGLVIESIYKIYQLSMKVVGLIRGSG